MRGVSTDDPPVPPPPDAPAPGTAVAGLELRPLLAGDADRYLALAQANREHLTAHGDYVDEVAASVGDVRAQLERTAADPPLTFGIWWQDTLVGRCDLVPVDPPRYGLGYWVSAASQGRGLASAAVSAVLAYAQTRCTATDVFAGVTHGNERSVALLRRLGFVEAARFERYTRFHRRLG
ncbi:MAG: GNAT family N-acetyltransferase [Actinobacteria bacterium]|nr:GNAT family N-acetyltransferase [Actinomycetota bacterium]